MGRCSIDPRKDSPYLLIRNEKIRGSIQLNAGLGDIVMTRDGGFVGIVTGFEQGSNPEARVLLFSDSAIWEKAFKIPTQKDTGSRYADNFGNAVRSFKGERH